MPLVKALLKDTTYGYQCDILLPKKKKKNLQNDSIFIKTNLSIRIF